MASTTFFPGTVIASSWLNAVNNSVYNIIPTLAPLNAPTFVSPNLGSATAASINKVSFTPVVTSATWSIANLKTFTVNNSITLAGSDDSVLTLGAGASSFSGTSSGTNTGDQLTFKTISVSGQSDVVADSSTDTLTIAAGAGVVLTTDATSDTVTIAAPGTVSYYTLLNQMTVSTAVANIDFLNVFTSAYDHYVVELQGLISSNTSSNILSVQVASSGSVITGVTQYGAVVPTGTTTLGSLPQTQLRASTSSNTYGNQGLYAMALDFYSVNSTATKFMSARGAFHAVTPNSPEVVIGMAIIPGLGVALSGFRLLWSAGGNFTAGTVRIYGIKNN